MNDLGVIHTVECLPGVKPARFPVALAVVVEPPGLAHLPTSQVHTDCVGEFLATLEMTAICARVPILQTTATGPSVALKGEVGMIPPGWRVNTMDVATLATRLYHSSLFRLVWGIGTDLEACRIVTVLYIRSVVESAEQCICTILRKPDCNDSRQDLNEQGLAFVIKWLKSVADRAANGMVAIAQFSHRELAEHW